MSLVGDDRCGKVRSFGARTVSNCCHSDGRQMVQRMMTDLAHWSGYCWSSMDLMMELAHWLGYRWNLMDLMIVALLLGRSDWILMVAGSVAAGLLWMSLYP